MTEKAKLLGKQSASPTIEFSRYTEDCPFNSSTECGLTKREHFASMAMQGLLASSITMASCASYAKYAVECADALLEELLK